MPDYLVRNSLPPHLFTDGWGPDPRELSQVRLTSDLMFGALAVVYPAWHWVFRALMTDPRDSLGERLLVAAASLFAILASRLRVLKRALPAIEHGVLALMTAHYLTLVWRNDFAVPYVVGLYIVFASVGMVISRLRVAVTYAAAGMAALVVMTVLHGRARADLELELGLATLLVAMCVGAYRTTTVRRMAMHRLLQERQLMKQIIEAIPDPVFVRNDQRDLVLTNEAGRQFEHATGYDTEPIVEQELTTLTDGRALTLDSAVKTRFGEISMSVKTARAETVNNKTMLVTVMRDVTDRRALEDSLRSKIRELEQAREQVRRLKGMLPICMHCNRIRTESDEWQTLERYVAGHTDASFTHTLCKSCLEQHYPEEGAT